MESVRILGPGDEAELEAFLRGHRDTAMFLRGNLARVGLVDEGARHQGTYAAAYDGDRIVGVVAHAWNGMLLPAAPLGLVAAARDAVQGSGRPVQGFSGAVDQVRCLRRTFGLLDAPAQIDSEEVLFGLDLTDLRVPAALARGEVRVRRAEASDRETLRTWWRAYSIETLGDAAGPRLDARVAESVEAALAGRSSWVLEHEGRIVAKTGFNAATRDCVQVGGVFTPPAWRGRGFGRCVVAGSLEDARREGADRSILFTEQGNLPAQACYRALGYEELGGYGLVLFQDGHALG